MTLSLPHARRAFTAALLALGGAGCAQFGWPDAAAPNAVPKATAQGQAAASACPPAAVKPTPEQMQAGMKTARDRGFLWRISKSGRQSYLYGTVHVARQEWMYPGPTLVKAVQASDVVALELDMLDDNIMQRLQASMAPPGALPALQPELAERLRAQVREACLSQQLLNTMSPDLVATTLVAMSARRDGLDPSYAIDAVYSAMARGLMKSIVSLETPEMQIGILQGKTESAVQETVQQVLGELESDKARPMMLRIANVWAESRLSELTHYEEWCNCLNTEQERAMHQRLLNDRNPDLVRRIDALHAEGKQVFAAVGSLHMVGPNGLPKLLEQRGYRVERVEFKR